VRRTITRKDVGKVTLEKWLSFVSQNTRKMWRRSLSVSADAQCYNKKNLVKEVDLSGR